MPNVYLPFIATAPAPVVVAAQTNARGFGVGFHSGNKRIPYARLIQLLRSPCWHDWGSKRQATEWEPGNYPQIWNPAKNVYAAWPPGLPEKRPRQWWFIGNEPLNPVTRVIWCPAQEMTNQARALNLTTGVEYILCGEYPDEAGVAYCKEMLRLGAYPIAWAWHIYETTIAAWKQRLEAALRFDPNRPVYITETAIWFGTVDDQRRLMDYIMRALDDYAQLAAVFWFVSYMPQVGEGSVGPTPLPICLVDGDRPDCQLTETGRHYVNLIK